MRYRQQEAARRAQERRDREDAAPRLRDVARTLQTLSITVHDKGEHGVLAGVGYVRHVVVDRAPALFVIPCTDSTCEDGGHDVTADVLAALRKGKTEFSGEDACYGTRGGVSCARVMHFVGKATYADEDR